MEQDKEARILKLEKIAYDPYERIEHPTSADWRKSYDALVELSALAPESGMYQNTLGYLCYYGRHTDGVCQYEEARKWFEEGAERKVIESQYKLADMLAAGLGGEKDSKRAMGYYFDMYWFCRIQFESGIREGKFADTALRMGRIFHEGKLVERDDMEALGYLLEARYAIECRKEYDHFGDETVEKNIRQLIDACKKPDEGMRKSPIIGMNIGRVPYFLMAEEEDQMTIDLDVDEDNGQTRLEFRRKRKDGKKPNRILWSVAPAMRCLMTDAVVLYAAEIRMIWNIHPGEQVVCDRYEYDEEKDLHQFFLGDELQCKLMGGLYALAMNEFIYMEMRDHPEMGSDICQ